MIQDIRYALRNLRLNPGFTVVALLALALGIGVNSAIFSVVHAVLLRPMPYPEPDRLVQVVRQYPNVTAPALSGMRFLKWANEARSFESATAYDVIGSGVNLSGSGDPERIPSIRVTPHFFRTFGVQPAAGRGFTPDDAKPGASKVIVISHGLWLRKFGGDAGILGRTALVNGTPHQVIGIMPPGFESSPRADVWVPLYLQPDPNDSGNMYLTVARLKDSVTLDQAKAETASIHKSFGEQYPNLRNNNESIGLYPIREFLTSDVKPSLLILLGAVGLVLLIACANVANLLLARATARAKEIAIRAAMGAGRGRIMRQLLTESAILALGGAALGLLLGSWLLGLLLRMSPRNLPRLNEISIDGTVVAVTLVLSLLTALFFGLAPAFQASKADVNQVLREQGRGTSSGTGRRRLRNVLVVSEVALCVVLLVSATLLIRSFVGLMKVDAGFHPENVLTFKVSMTPDRYKTTAQIAEFGRQVLMRMDSLPGVTAAASATSLPLELGPDLPFDIEGRPRQGNESTGGAQWRAVTPNYFKAMGTPLKAGRFYTDSDTGNSQPVIMINEALVRRYFPGKNPIGERITIGRVMGPRWADSTRLIVGVVGDMKEIGIDREAPSTVYLPMTQMPEFMASNMISVVPSSWVIRGTANPYDLLASVRKEIQSVDPMLPVAEVRSMTEIVDRSIAQRRFNTTLLTLFAALALTLAVIGIYGVISYSVSQRTQEIGIRVALGAGSGETMRMIFGETMKLAGVGIVLGVIAALALSRLMSSLLFGVTATDPPTYLLAIAALLVAAAVASVLPARRALRVDPAVALRCE